MGPFSPKSPPKSPQKTPPKSPTPEDDTDDEDLLKEDITGMSLANPNYFSERMFKRDPKLFLKKK